MIASMTGFARREAAGPFGTLVCEIRSVNHRFLDAGLRLPDGCRALEPELRSALAQELRRGKVDCTLQQRDALPGAAVPEVDAAAVERLLAAMGELATAVTRRPQFASEPVRIDLVDLLRHPGVLKEQAADSETLLAAARELFRATLADLIAARAREGERLAATIATRCAALTALIAGVRTRLPEVHARIRARFAERLSELGAQIDHERMEQEVLLMLQRFDVAEELDRLEGHIEECTRALTAREPAGRRLDFLMQEFNREANTLSSKSQDLETTRSAVEMKVLIEQMREQVQNLE